MIELEEILRIQEATKLGVKPVEFYPYNIALIESLDITSLKLFKINERSKVTFKQVTREMLRKL